jgi:hypothetical protein
MIKVMHLINEICESNPEYFKGKTIGSISVINPEFGENNSRPINELR